MKAKLYLFALVLGSLFVACKKDKIEHKADYARSLRAWENFKATSGNSYRFTITTSSWSGFASETVITVRNGQPVQRDYIAKRMIDYSTGQVDILEQWSENGASLRTHTNGADPITLDEIHHKAKTDWLRKRDNADTFFEAKNNGMISSAGYVEDGCQDDCFRGIRITNIEKV